MMYRCMLSCMQYVLLACVYVGVYLQGCMHMCVCVSRSVPLCVASVQKGLVPTTWCRAASAPPILAWIATLAANQKLPAAFAVCPLSIFSNTSLNLLASLGCCIKTPHSTRSHIISFLCLCYDNSSVTYLHTRGHGNLWAQMNFSASNVNCMSEGNISSVSSWRLETWFDVFRMITANTSCCSFIRCRTIERTFSYTSILFASHYAQVLIMPTHRQLYSICAYMWVGKTHTQYMQRVHTAAPMVCQFVVWILPCYRRQ